MGNTAPKGMEQDKAMALSRCICKGCPSWAECGEKGAFCFPTIGKSGCIKAEKGCICGGCPLTKIMGLRHGYYCIRGSEKEQSA